MSLIRAKVTKEFSGVEDGSVYPRQILVGEEVSGALAEAAIAEKWAKETRESKMDRGVEDDEAARLLEEEQARVQAAAELQAKRDEATAKLALLTHAQLEAIAAEHKIDIAAATSEAEVISAIQRALEALGLDVPSPQSEVKSPDGQIAGDGATPIA
ncbi:hypothetical protein AB7M45_007814 [Bradyrhizobium elkanii]|uniref:hypothetical protein n=1 Tax=Bradyrhizobium elkanii TaxID=29448 RepID=UPI000912C8E6|nr:hypothetical protein [Bradyrhizobium elkanii]MCW2195041.1 hypothetical protein [Bradyrhizobium elkanii]NWL67264.1 hypothetical protein [Bradyrhizobium elkanii]OIM91629.1 hypothetical protein BLN97_26520 [Bradyrhizobium elkanii]